MPSPAQSFGSPLEDLAFSSEFLRQPGHEPEDDPQGDTRQDPEDHDRALGRLVRAITELVDVATPTARHVMDPHRRETSDHDIPQESEVQKGLHGRSREFPSALARKGPAAIRVPYKNPVRDAVQGWVAAAIPNPDRSRDELRYASVRSRGRTPMTIDQERVTLYLKRIQDGDSAAVDELVPHVYEDLHKLAKKVFSDQWQNHTLQPTALVHEAYMRLVNSNEAEWENKRHFLRVAALAMRQLLTDYARRKRSQKREGDRQRVILDDVEPSTDEPGVGPGRPRRGADRAGRPRRAPSPHRRCCAI